MRSVEPTTIEEAKQLLTATPADVVVVDYRLPDGTGVELVSTLREDMPGVGFVMVTVFPDPGGPFRRAQGGVPWFCRKRVG